MTLMRVATATAVALATLCSMLLLPAVGLAATAPTFTEVTEKAGTSNVSGLVVNDLDRDGDYDIFVGHLTGYSLFPGGSGGTFGTRYDVTTGDFPADLLLANVVGDSRKDLLLIAMNTDRVASINNQGMVLGPVAGTSITDPNSFASARINSDTKDDLVIGTQGSGVYKAINDGDGTFTNSAMSVAAFSGAAFVAAGQLNSDGKVDFVAANYAAGGGLRVYLNSGTGTFPTEATYSTGASPTQPVVANVVGSSRADVVVSNEDSASVYVYRNTGSGTLATPTDLPVCSTPQEVAVSEFNGDAYRDIAVACYDAGGVRVLYGTGSGNFSSNTTTTGCSGASELVAADVNHDDRIDLVVTCYAATTFAYLRNTTTFPKAAITGTKAASIGATSFTAKATITPRYQVTRVRAQWGLAGHSLSHSTATVTIPRSTTPRVVARAISGLAPGATYRFRFVAVSAAGTKIGPTKTVTLA